MDEQDWLADRFQEHRAHLHAVAYRMLGSRSEADDAVQEAWLRLSRSDTSGVENLGGWLTTIVARVSLNMLHSRRSRREQPVGDGMPTTAATGAVDPEQEALQADSVGLALMVVLDTLTPAERLAFVLHDMFAVPFEEIAPMVGRTPTAARQLASRARRRVQGAAVPQGDQAGHREIVDAFLAASRGGDFQALLSLLDPEVVLRADEAAARLGGSREVAGAKAVAETFSGRARAAQPAVIDGAPGLVWMAGRQPRVVFEFTISDGRIVGIELLSDPERLRELLIELPDD
jgi:RNA polymerase sigma-70 factor (ECF subfamily)